MSEFEKECERQGVTLEQVKILFSTVVMPKTYKVDHNHYSTANNWGCCGAMEVGVLKSNRRAYPNSSIPAYIYTITPPNVVHDFTEELKHDSSRVKRVKTETVVVNDPEGTLNILISTLKGGSTL